MCSASKQGRGASVYRNPAFRQEGDIRGFSCGGILFLMPKKKSKGKGGPSKKHALEER